MVHVVKKDDVPTIVIELEWKSDAAIPLAQIYDAEYFHIFGLTLNGDAVSNDTMLTTSQPLSTTSPSASPSAAKEDETVVSFDNDGNRVEDTKQLGGDKISGTYALLHGIFNSVEKVASTGTVSPGTTITTEINEDDVQSIYVPPIPIESTDSSPLATPGDSTVQLTLTLDDFGQSDHTHATSSLSDYINQMKVENANNIQCFVKSGLDYHTVELIALDLYKQITYLGTKNIEFKDLSLSDVYYICGNYVIVKSGDGFVVKGVSEEKSQAVRYKELIRDMIDEGCEEKRIVEVSNEWRLWWL